MITGVASRRKKYGIKYPALYADGGHVDNCQCTKEDVEEFNCAQRAHQNTLESLSTIQILGALNGLLCTPYYRLL